MAFRDSIPAPLDRVRAIGARLGLRVYTVRIRTRVWTGPRQGMGTNTDLDTPALVTRLSVTDGAMTTGLASLTCSPSAPFVSSDVGKTILVPGAGPGGVNLITTIASYGSSSFVTLASTATTTVASAAVSFGYPCLVRQLKRSEVFASGGLYSDQDLKVGPLTPAYVNPVTGGYTDVAIEPAAAPASEVFWLVSGPQVPATGGVFVQIGEEATALHYYVILRKAPAAQ